MLLKNKTEGIRNDLPGDQALLIWCQDSITKKARTAGLWEFSAKYFTFEVNPRT